MTVDLAAVRAELAGAGPADRTAWEQVRALLLEAVGESQFEIWLEPVQLIAVDRAGTLVAAAPDATAAWIRSRFDRLLSQCAERVGRPVRLAGAAERAAAEALNPAIDFDVHNQPREASG